MMNVQNKQLTSIGNGASEQELDAIKRIFASLLLANKNLSLYPHGHSICLNSINQLHTQLTAFLHTYGTLRLEIERERIVSRGEGISSGFPDEGTLHFTLFRDGIQWLEFMDGIAHKELHDILLMVNNYTKLSAEPEGDIVTAFWEAQFPHIQYEVAEFFWDGDQQTGNRTFDLTAEKSTAPLREKNLEGSEIQSDPAIDQASLALTPQEKVRLKEMICLEEEADLTSYLDALMDSLLQHREKETFSIILEVLAEDFTGSLARRDFIVTLKILQGLRYVLGICKEEIPWAGPSIEEFLVTVSDTQSLSPLKEGWNLIDSEEAETLGQIFKLLHPQAIRTLGVLLLQIQPMPLRSMLLDSISCLSSRDMRPLEWLLDNSDDKIVEKLVPVIVSLEGEQSLKYLMKLTHHPSERVRREAIKGIFTRDPVHVKDIFNLIDDKEDSIRQLVLKQLGQSRNDVVEELLLSYLRKTTFSKNEENHVILCFRTLGKCGSSRSVTFLRETLLRWGWMPGFWRSAQRRGAAIALKTLGISEAEQILKHAGQSIYPGLRDIVRKVMRESSHSGGG
jgi:hypothetical protein